MLKQFVKVFLPEADLTAQSERRKMDVPIIMTISNCLENESGAL